MDEHAFEEELKALALDFTARMGLYCFLTRLRPAFLLLFICPALTVHAQKRKAIIDSLERVILVQTDTNLVKSYSELTWQYRAVDRDKAVAYGWQAIRLGKKINFQKGLGQAYNDLGIIYFDKENYDSAIALYNEGLKIREQLKDVLGKARLYNKIGVIHQRRGDFVNALINQQSALNLFESVNDSIGISYSLNNIGILEQNLGRYDESIRYYTQSIAIKQRIHDRGGLVESYVNIGNSLRLKEENEQAEAYYEKAVDLARQLTSKTSLATSLNNLADLLHKKHEYAEAEILLKESFGLREAMKDTKGMVSCLILWGDGLIEQQRLDTAAVVLERAEALATEGVNTRPELIKVFMIESKLYEKRSDLTKSLYYYKKYAAFKDSLFSHSLGEKFADLEVRYNTLKKEQTIEIQKSELSKKLYELSQGKLLLSEKELLVSAGELSIKRQNEEILEQRLDSVHRAQRIAVLQQQNELKDSRIRQSSIVITGLVALLAAASGLVLLWRNRTRLKQQATLYAAMSEHRQLQLQAVITSQEEERKRFAADMHDGVGQMISAVRLGLSKDKVDASAVSYSLELLGEMNSEIRNIAFNLMPQVLMNEGLEEALNEFAQRISKTGKVQITVRSFELKTVLTAEQRIALYRICQEWVNNVLKYSGAKLIAIQLIQHPEELMITIEDDGNGFDKKLFLLGTGNGWRNINSRLSLIGGTMEIDSEPGRSGTIVVITVPAYPPARI